MLNRYPKYVGELEDLLADPLLKYLTHKELARFLGVTERTIRRWKNSKTPRHVLLVLWAFSSAGLADRHREAMNTAALHAQLNAALLANEHGRHQRTDQAANDPGRETRQRPALTLVKAAPAAQTSAPASVGGR